MADGYLIEEGPSVPVETEDERRRRLGLPPLGAPIEPVVFEEPDVPVQQPYAGAPAGVQGSPPSWEAPVTAGSRVPYEPFQFEEPAWAPPVTDRGETGDVFLPPTEDDEPIEEPFIPEPEEEPEPLRQAAREPFIFEEPEPVPSETVAEARALVEEPEPEAPAVLAAREGQDEADQQQEARVEAARWRALRALDEEEEEPLTEARPLARQPGNAALPVGDEPLPEVLGTPEASEYWGEEATTARPQSIIPTTTVEGLASLPALNYGGLGDEGAQLGYNVRTAQGLTQARDELARPYDRDRLRSDLVSRGVSEADAARAIALPEADDFIAEENQGRSAARDRVVAAISDIDTAMGEAELRQRIEAQALQARLAAGRPLTYELEGAGLDGETIRGTYKDNVFTPTRSLRPGEHARVIAALADRDVQVNRIAETTRGDELLGNVLTPLQEGVRLVAASPIVNNPVAAAAWAGGTTLVETTLDALAWASDRAKEAALASIEGGSLTALGALTGGGFAGPGTTSITTRDDTALRDELKKLSPQERNKLAPSAWSIMALGNQPAIAEDLARGMKPEDVAQKYNVFPLELAGDFLMDPLNLIVPGVNLVREAKGLQSASGAINLQDKLFAHGVQRAIGHVSDADAIEPWANLRRFGDVRALADTRPGASRLDVLGTAGQQARASASRNYADEVTGFFERALRSDDGARIQTEALEPWLRDLATQGADLTVAQRLNGNRATLAAQHARMVAPDVLKVIETPTSDLAKAINAPVYEGGIDGWNALSRQERATLIKKGVYPTEAEKGHAVLEALQDTTNRAARSKFGLDPLEDGAIVKAQNAYRGVLSTVYLFNPRYYIRNALGDQVTAMERGFSAFSTPRAIREFGQRIGKVRAETGVSPGLDTITTKTDINKFNIPGRIQKWAGKGEGYRRESVYMNSYKQHWPQMRQATLEEGRPLLDPFLRERPDVASVIERALLDAESVDDIRALKASRGAIKDAQFTARWVLDDLDTGNLQPGLRVALNQIALKALKGQDVEADIAKLLDRTAAHATAANGHLGDVKLTADDWRALKTEVDALTAMGTPRQQAIVQAIGGFTDGHQTNARIAQRWTEIEERLANGKMNKMFVQEYRGLQAKSRDLRETWTAERNRLRDAALATPPDQRGPAWEAYYRYTQDQRKRIDQTVLQDLNGLVVKMRTAQNGTGFGGAKVAQQFENVDQMTAHLESQIAALRRKMQQATARAAAGAPPIDPAVAAGGAARPILPRALAGAKPRYGYGNRLFEIAFDDDIDRAAYIIRNRKKLSPRDRDYMQFVTSNLGIDETEARRLGDEVAARLKAEAQAAAPGESVITLRSASGAPPTPAAVRPTRPQIRRQEQAEDLTAALRDAEDALANLKGAGKIETPVQQPMLGATAAAGSSAYDALWVLHFQDRLPAALADFTRQRGAISQLAPHQVRMLNSYLDDQVKLFQRDRLAADGAANAMTNWVLHNYNKTYDFDWYMRWVNPWELWVNRTLAKLPLRIADHPAYFSKVGILRNEMEFAHQDRPEYLRDKVKVPVPFLPGWMGDSLFFDPVKLALPTDMLDNFVRQEEEDTTVGRVRSLASFVNQTPGPVLDTLLAMAPQPHGGGLPWWATQRRSPIADQWGLVAPALQRLGIPVASRPIATSTDLREARRQIAMMVASGEATAEQARAANLALDQHFTTGTQLLQQDLKDERARTALNRALDRQSARSGLSLLGILAPTLETEAERARGQSGYGEGDATGLYAELEKARLQGKEAVNEFYRQHPEFEFWTKTGLDQKLHGQLTTDAMYYKERAKVFEERDKKLAALPMFGTDQDRARIRRETDAAMAALEADMKERNPDWTPERVKPHRDLVDQLVSGIFEQKAPRDSNGVLDFEALKGMREQQLQAAAQAPVLFADSADVIDAAVPRQDLRAQVEAAMLPKDPKQAAARAYEDAYYAALDQRSEAGKNAKTREDAARARQAFTETWKPPTPEQIADAVEKKHPGKYDRDAVLAAAKSGNVPGSMDAFAALNEQERIAKFRATMNEKGVSEEPFYGGKNNGVSPIVIKTEGDLQNYLGAKADDQQYRDRRARNDPTYVLFDTERRQRWLLSGEDGAQLWRQEQAILENALGPMSASTGQRSGGKGWMAEFRFPNGDKMTNIQAYNLINKFQSDLSKQQNPESGALPSEKADASKQTAAANQASRSTGNRTTSTRTTGTTRSRGGSGRSTPSDPGPRPGAVRWFDDSQLRRDRLTGADGQPAVNIREEWRKGAGLTPEAFAAFIKRNPDADAAIAEMEKRQQAMGTPNIDLNAATAAVQEQALAVSAALEAARAKDQERKAGPPTPALTNINDSYLKASRIRTGVVDFDRAFRTGTSGLGSEQKWAEFLQRHPDIRGAISALQKAADALKTTDEYPDDTAQMLALYDQTANVAAMITAGKEADAENERARKEAERDAKNEAEREAKKQENARIEGPPRPAISNINDAWLKPERLRLGVTDFNYAFRLGTSGLGAQTAWDSFLAKHPPIQQAIAALQTDASRLKSSRRDPDDAAAMMAFYDRVAAVSDLISTARQADSDARTAARSEQRQRERDQERADRQDSRRGATVGFAEGWTGGPAAGRRKARAEAAARRRR